MSPLLMVTTGMSALYNLWLAVMMIGLWVAQRLTKREVGIAVGDLGSYAIAVGYVAGIIGCVALGAWARVSVASARKPVASVGMRSP